MFLVILPQAFRSIIPQVGNYLISNIKDTSMLSVITVGELFYRGREAAGQYFRFFEVFLIVSCIYLFMTTVATLLLRLVEKKLSGPKNYDCLLYTSSSGSTGRRSAICRLSRRCSDSAGSISASVNPCHGCVVLTASVSASTAENVITTTSGTLYQILFLRRTRCFFLSDVFCM